MYNSYDELKIRDAADLLMMPGMVYESRVPKVKNDNEKEKTFIGFFNEPDKLAQAASKASGNAPAVYISLNPVNPELLPRSINHYTPYVKAASAEDVLKRALILIDCDPQNTAGDEGKHDSKVSSTDAEHDAAIECADCVRAYL